MRRHAVASSAVRTIGYDPRRRWLEVEWHSGKVYRYLDVSAEAYAALKNADSLGAHLNRHIVGHHKHERVA